LEDLFLLLKGFFAPRDLALLDPSGRKNLSRAEKNLPREEKRAVFLASVRNYYFLALSCPFSLTPFSTFFC
jgi:hypothetical protein